MSKHVLLKNDNDGFGYFAPKEEFEMEYGRKYTHVFDTLYAYYDHKLFDKIEKEFNGFFIKKEARTMISGNAKAVANEIIYLVPRFELLIAVLVHYDQTDYKVDPDEDDMDEDGFSNGFVDNYAPKVKITKKSKFQGKVTMYANSYDHLEFVNKLVSKKVRLKPMKNMLNIVCAGEGGMYLEAFETNKVDIILEENYNDDFMEVSECILSRLKKNNDNGIVLLHSDPGCGKTNYLRYLIQRITKKRLIYLPPDMAHRIADPDFIAFLMSYPNSILIIEDAENALQRRDSGGNQAVSNLLNNSDGLLGDALKIQIVCTFNCSIKQIDPALMRPGRLIAEYKFDKLSKEKTRKLITKLYGEESEFLQKVQEMTLAEIYNLSQKKYSTKQSGPMGFQRSY